MLFMEVDCVFSIANPFALYYMHQDYPIDVKIFQGLEKRILEVAQEKAANPKSTARYNKLWLYEKNFAESNLQELQDKLVVPMTAITIMDPASTQKEIICPFSNQNYVTTRMQDLLDDVPLDFSSQFVFAPISPVDFWFVSGEKDEQKGWFHPMPYLVNEVNDAVKGIGFGALHKNGYVPKQGNFNVYAGLLEPRFAINRFNRHPESFADALKDLNVTEDTYGEYCHAISSFCLKILARKYLYTFNKLDLVKTMYDFGLDKISYFGEKGSYGAKVLKLVEKYSQGKFGFDFIGNGIFDGLSEITTQGAAHDTAMHKLFGFVKKLYEAESGVVLQRPESRPVPAWIRRGSDEKTKIKYRPCPKYNFFLCEFPECKSPCAKDIIENHVSEKELYYIKRFAEYKRVGFSRIEPRLVQLANQDFRVYVGDRRRSKLNSSWQNIELDNKRIDFIDLSGYVDKEDKVGDLRGSEFAQPCDIARLFSKLDREKRFKIVSEELKKNPELKEDFFRTNDPDTLEGTAAIRGTAIHRVIAQPMKNLAHYETLARGGLDVVPSDFYTELAFCHEHTVKKTGETIKISFHPDLQAVLQRPDGLDLLIMDHKTNRRIPYPYVKYKNQGKVYAYCLSEITGIPFINTYLLFNHMAFDNMFGMTFESPSGFPGSEILYRQQSFVPPTVYYPEHCFRQEVVEEIDRTFLMQKELRQDPKMFLKYKNTFCGSCFSDQKMMCNYFAQKAARGIKYETAVEELEQ